MEAQKEGCSKTRNRRWLGVVGLMGSLAVGAGAFGAHGLEDKVSTDRLETWAVGTRYLMWHTLALLVVVFNMGDSNRWQLVLWFWTVGALIFACSLYVLVLLDLSWLGAITPSGGVLLICGWLALSWKGFRGEP
ncbi:MAG: DUF423 domain-containing protein [Myxococcota bacterium]|nr:DUF423 domain-containing protein [Myxococcota bacterium]